MLQKLAFAFLLALVSASLAAQQPAPTYGVDDVTTYVIAAWDMQPSSSDVEWDIDTENWHRHLQSSGSLIGVVHLPQGAQIVSIALEGCDDTPLGSITASLTRTTFGGVNTLLAEASTSIPGTPGCLYVSTDLATPVTVENNGYRYMVSAQNNTTSSTTIGAVRIRYRLQVSPPPADATFGDMPTSDPAFQFVEALAASGITVGCGGGNYCPDSPLTRRQMAVFLAKALGLHWVDGPVF